MSCLALPLAAPGEWGFCIYNPFPVHNRSESACCRVVRPEGPALMKSDGSEAAGHTAPDSTPPGSGVRLGRLTKAADLHPERGPTRLGTPGLTPIRSPAGPLPAPTPPLRPRRAPHGARCGCGRLQHSRPAPGFPAAKPTASPGTEPLSCLEAQPCLRSLDRRKHCTKDESCSQSLDTDPPRQGSVRGWRGA